MLTRPLILSSFLALAALGLSGCGGPVASDAPALLTMEQIAARSANDLDTTRGVQAQRELQWRAARLRARAAQIRAAGIPHAERTSLLRRAEALQSGQS